ncbi:unnamed protein product, partial [Scytosiphon promiscuus]
MTVVESKSHGRNVGHVLALSLLACREATGFVALPPAGVSAMRGAVSSHERPSSSHRLQLHEGRPYRARQQRSNPAVHTGLVLRCSNHHHQNNDNRSSNGNGNPQRRASALRAAAAAAFAGGSAARPSRDRRKSSGSGSGSHDAAPIRQGFPSPAWTPGRLRRFARLAATSGAAEDGAAANDGGEKSSPAEPAADGDGSVSDSSTPPPTPSAAAPASGDAKDESLATADDGGKAGVRAGKVIAGAASSEGMTVAASG